MAEGGHISILGKEIGYESNKTNLLTGGSSGSLVINNEKKAVAINYAGVMNNDQTESIQNFALMLNCDNPYYDGNSVASQYKYEVLRDFFQSTLS
jgi:hypothetical protein